MTTIQDSTNKLLSCIFRFFFAKNMGRRESTHIKTEINVRTGNENKKENVQSKKYILSICYIFY